MNQISETLKSHQKVPEQWLKGIGCYLLMIISLDSWLKMIFSEEVNDMFFYLILLTFMVYLPILLGYFLDWMGLTFRKVVHKHSLKFSHFQLDNIISWSLAIFFNMIAISRLFSRDSTTSFDLYFVPGLVKNMIVEHLLTFNLLVTIVVAIGLSFITLIFFRLFSVANNLFSWITELIIVSVMTRIAFLITQGLIYNDASNYHLNVVLFPVISLQFSSPFSPLISDGFISLYGGYFLWLNWLMNFVGNDFLSIKFLLSSLVALQVILYYGVIKCLLKNSLIRILSFLTGIFWGYLYFRFVSYDIYFQYFPLRTLFPSIFIITSFLTFRYSQKFFNRSIFSHSLFDITFRDLLLDAIVAISLLNNFDSGLSVLFMYFFIYNWNLINLVDWKLKPRCLVGFTVNLIIIIILFFLIFRVLTGSFPNLLLFTASTSKFGRGFFGLPFPDNLWIFFVVIYIFTLLESYFLSSEHIETKLRFSIAIWGLVSLLYFVNRSSSWNLLAISLPFFLCCGFWLEQFSNLIMFPDTLNNTKKNNQQISMRIQRHFSLSSMSFLKFAAYSVLNLPVIISFLIVCFLIIPLTSNHLKAPKSYLQMTNLEKLSDRVAVLEKHFDRPSVLISDSLESYFYLMGHRPILFYPEIPSIFDDSFRGRFIQVLNQFNPIVTVCSIKSHFTVPEIDLEFKKLLENSQFKVISSEIHPQSKGICSVYIKN